METIKQMIKKYLLIGVCLLLTMILLAQNINQYREIENLKMKITSLEFDLGDGAEVDDLNDRVDEIESMYYDLENDMQIMRSDLSNLQFQMW